MRRRLSIRFVRIVTNLSDAYLGLDLVVDCFRCCSIRLINGNTYLALEDLSIGIKLNKGVRSTPIESNACYGGKRLVGSINHFYSLGHIIASH